VIGSSDVLLGSVGAAPFDGCSKARPVPAPAVFGFEACCRAGTGITLSMAVPGLAQQLDTQYNVAATAPCPTLVVSGT